MNNSNHADEDLYAIIQSNPGSHSTQLTAQETQLPSSNQPIHYPRPQNRPPRGQSSQREAIRSSANVSLNPPAFPHPAEQSTHPLSSSPAEVLHSLLYQPQGPLHDPNSSQLEYRYPAHSEGIPTFTPVDSMQSCQIGVNRPSASICERRCQCAAFLSENVQLSSEVASLAAELADVKSRLEKVEKEAVLKPSGGESKPKRARSKKGVAPSQDKSPTMETPPFYRRRRSSLKAGKVPQKSGQKSPQVTARSQPKVVVRFTDLFSKSDSPSEASSSDPAAHSPCFLESTQANVGSQGIVFRQRRREAVNVAENSNEPPAQAERAQHEEADNIAGTSAEGETQHRNSRPKFFEE